jgi:hypothetical protein
MTGGNTVGRLLDSAFIHNGLDVPVDRHLGDTEAFADIRYLQGFFLFKPSQDLLAAFNGKHGTTPFFIHSVRVWEKGAGNKGKLDEKCENMLTCNKEDKQTSFFPHKEERCTLMHRSSSIGSSLE